MGNESTYSKAAWRYRFRLAILYGTLVALRRLCPLPVRLGRDNPRSAAVAQ